MSSCRRQAGRLGSSAFGPETKRRPIETYLQLNVHLEAQPIGAQTTTTTTTSTGATPKSLINDHQRRNIVDVYLSGLRTPHIQWTVDFLWKPT